MLIQSYDYWSSFHQGQDAYLAGLRDDQNPHGWSPEGRAWIDGYVRASKGKLYRPAGKLAA